MRSGGAEQGENRLEADVLSDLPVRCYSRITAASKVRADGIAVEMELDGGTRARARHEGGPKASPSTCTGRALATPSRGLARELA